MLFHSLEFAVFLPTVFAGYWLARSAGARNLWLLLASAVFYGWWDWRFLGLIALSSTVDYGVGRGLGATQEPGHRKALVALSVTVNLGLLAAFKYAGFFADSLSTAFALFGQPLELRGMEWVLPVGISFYTFQSLGYTLDVYRRRILPTDDALAFFTYVAFFPQLVAGPIERAERLLPQLTAPRTFDPEAARDGLRQILWGLAKKVVVADVCATQVDAIFASHDTLGGGVLALGAFLFAMQVYGDFSGYSDIAIGTARLFGIELMTNFRTPWFARDLGEYWRVWHISLSAWFRDYVFIPLGGSRGGRWATARNALVVFVLSGLWHGAAWTFVAWGAVHGLLWCGGYLVGRPHRRGVVAPDGALPSPAEALGMLRTSALVCLAFILFRAESLAHALDYASGLPSGGLAGAWPALWPPVALSLGLLAIEWPTRAHDHPLRALPPSRPARWAVYAVLAQAILWFAPGAADTYLYFQF